MTLSFRNDILDFVAFYQIIAGRMNTQLVCDSTCLTCQGIATNCTSCDTSSADFPHLVGNQCTLCGAGTFYSGTSCDTCDNTCLTC